MNNITVTLELCAEDRARLDKLQATMDKMTFTEGVVLEGVVLEGVVLEGVVEAIATEAPKSEPVEEQLPEQVAIPEVVEPEKTPEPQTEEPKPAVTKSDIQRKVVALSQAGKKAAVKDIVTAYGNTKVSDIPEDKLAEVLQKLTALEG